MDRDLLSHLPVILSVARRGGFAAAASELGMSASAVSHSVRVVEERLGVPLFARTTRSVALSEAGRALIETVGPALAEIDDRVERVRAVKGRVGGLLRLNVPSVALPMVTTPVLHTMAQRYPDVRVEVFIDNALSNIVAQGFDAGIRLGEMIAQDMLAVRLTPPFRAIIVGAPQYFERYGCPANLAELGRHSCIAYREIKGGGLYRWELQEAGRDVVFESERGFVVNDALYARELALQGLGLAYLFEPLVQADLTSGRLVVVLPHTAIEEPGLFLYFPKRSGQSPKLRAFIDAAKQVLLPKTPPQEQKPMARASSPKNQGAAHRTPTRVRSSRR